MPPEENGEANGEANGKANGEELSEKSKSEQKTEQFQEVQTTTPSNSGLTFQPSARTLEKLKTRLSTRYSYTKTNNSFRI